MVLPCQSRQYRRLTNKTTTFFFFHFVSSFVIMVSLTTWIPKFKLLTLAHFMYITVSLYISPSTESKKNICSVLPAHIVIHSSRMGLKAEYCNICKAANRTIVELKLMIQHANPSHNSTTNRTIVELKH